MLRGIVLGDLWGIEESVWVQLWSGTVGAIVSAVVAAVVAVLVLTRSNAHQRRLAMEQMDEQRMLAGLQLAEQRREAARGREQAAIAEVVIANEHFTVVSMQTRKELESHFNVFKAAAGRWRVEVGRGPMADELSRWGLVLFAATLLRQVEAESKGDEAKSDSYTVKIMHDAVSSLSSVALAWSSADDSQRVLLQEKLTEWRKANEEMLAEFLRASMNS